MNTSTPHQGPVHELFATRARSRPAAPAVISGARTLSYGELDAQANRVARLLRDSGVSTEVPVIVCVERSELMLVGLLGVFKASGVYVPLDPKHPAQRNRFVIEDTAAPVVLTTRKLAAGLTHGKARVILLDELGPDTAGPGTPPATTDPHDLAYIIYTSGSTGTPKGVMVEHANLLSHLDTIADVFGYTETDRTLVSAGTAFDVCVEQLLTPLHRGATAVIQPDDVMAPADVVRYAQEHSVTVLNMTPVYLDAVLRENADLATVRLIISGGDVIRPGIVRAAHTTLADKRVLNVYGPTETTITPLVQDLREVAGGDTVPIGRPVPGTRVHLMGEDGTETERGEVGEILIGGDRVARGYLNQPALTEKQFIPDPFGPKGGRLYRTGDLGRWLPSGSLEFCGRFDDQVKIRGHRVTLGEVESALAALPGVLGAAVVARPDPAGDTRLTGYVTTAVDADVAPEPRAALQGLLPAHMVPAAVVELDSFPMTPNGKIDREALPEPPPLGSPPSDPAAAPSDPLTALLAKIWADVLQVDAVGVHDNFFDLGGHSLLAFQLAARLSAAVGRDVPLNLIFECPTVAQMAATTGALHTPEPSTPAPTRGARTEGPLSAGQERLWIIQSLDPAGYHYNVPSLWQLTGEVDADALEHALNGLAARHEILRTRFVAGQDGPRQIVRPKDPPAIRMTRQSIDLGPDHATDTLPKEVFALAEEPFDLSAGPPMRAGLFTDPGRPHNALFLMVFHHIAIDGGSLPTALRDLEALYRQAAGEQQALSEPALQFLDFAVWAQNRPADDTERHLSYWRRQLKDLATLNLPTDHRRPAYWSGHGACVEFLLPADVAGGLRALGSEESASSFMVLLAAFKVVLARWSGQHDIGVGAAMTGRSLPELQELVGFLTDTTVLRCEVNGDRTFREVLGDVREATLGAMRHNLVSYSQVVEELRPERHLDRNPVFQAFFSYEAADDLPHWALPHAEARARHWPMSSSKFDLDLTCAESGDSLFCSLIYATDLFESASMERFCADLRSALDFLVHGGGPDVALAFWEPLTEGRAAMSGRKDG